MERCENIMAFSSHRKFFKGELCGVSTYDLIDLDYTIENLDERLGYIRKKLNKVGGFLNTYITGTEEEEFYKVSLNKDDDLSEEINIFKYVERYGSYLLNSKDIPREKQQQYNFLSEEDFKNILKKEKSLNVLVSGSDEESDVMEILEPKKNNQYTNLDHKITQKDMNDERSKQVLTEYSNYRDILREEMERIKNKENSTMNLYKVRSLMKDINDDMINAKISLQGIRNPAKRLGDESGAFYTEKIDYTDEKHIKAILRTVRLDSDLEPDSELSHIAYDMRMAIGDLHKNGTLNKLELEIIECHNCGYTNVKIGEELSLNERMVRYNLNKIIKKITKYFNKK